MKNGQIRSFKDQIKETETFKKWSPMVQKITLTRNVLQKINSGVKIAKNVGLNKFEQEFNYHPRNVELIKELIG